MLYKMQTEGYKTVAPSQAATKEFMDHMNTYNKRTVWSSNCRSWLKGGTFPTREYFLCSWITDILAGNEDNAPLCHPGSRTHWFHMLTEPRWEDWEWERVSENRFSYLGNGWTTWEEKGKDLSYYLDDPDAGFETIRY